MNAAVSTRPAPAERKVPAWALALPVLVVLVAVGTGIFLIESGRTSESVWVGAGHARVGAPAPSFASWDLSGKKVSLSDYRGKPVLLTFWATWCTVCKDELPALQGLRDRYSSDGFVVLGVNYRETGSARMTAYLTSLHVNIESVVDPAGSIAAAYNVDIGLPVNVLADRTGTVVRVLIGDVPAGTVQSAVSQLVAPAT